MNEYLKNRQIAFTLWGTIVGYGVLGLPKKMAESAGTGAWFSLAIATIGAIIITYIITYLGYVHENKTLYEYSQILVGKYITYAFTLLYIVYFFLTFTMYIRLSSEVIKLTMLLKTPIWALVLLFIIVEYYAVIKGLKVIARICGFYGLVIIFGALILHFLMFTEGKLVNLRPFFVAADITKYLKASFATVIPFLGMEVLTFVPIHKQNKKSIFKYVTAMIVFIGIMYIIEVESCISVIGVDDVIHYKDTLLAIIRRIEIRYLEIFRRLDGIFLIAWIMAVFCTVMIFSYGTVFYISRLFKNENFKLTTFVVMLLSFIISFIPKTFDDIEKVIEVTGYLGIIAAVVIPVILLIITKVKKV